MRQISKTLAAASVTLVLAAAYAAEPLATVETNWEGVSLDIRAVDRKGSVLTVKWAVKNEGEKSHKIKFTLTGKNPHTYVVDEESGTKYYTLTDKEGHTLASMHVYIAGGTSGISFTAEPERTMRLWMKLPAPLPEVKTLTLFFDGAVEPVEDVPITDK